MTPAEYYGFPEGAKVNFHYINFYDSQEDNYPCPSSMKYAYAYESRNVVKLKDTSNVTMMPYMFYNCELLTSVPMMDTSKVTTMENMFYNCKYLTTIPPLDTSKVTDMEEAFYGCSKLTSVPQLNTCKVKKMNNLFRNCGNLISVGGIDTSSATTMNYMFASCFKLQEVRFTGNPINLTSVTSITQGCPQTGTLYYPAEYADAYQIIINAFPTNWVKVPE